MASPPLLLRSNPQSTAVVKDQLSSSLYHDLEWNNDTSFYYRLEQCHTLHFDEGILRPNWLDDVTYRGQRTVNGFLCKVWEEVDFITYFEGVVTKRPVKWIFYTCGNDGVDSDYNRSHSGRKREKLCIDRVETTRNWSN